MTPNEPKWTKPVIGLVGGIGAGKSAAAGILESLGAGVIDSDRLAHEQLSCPEVAAVLKGWWGPSIQASDGGIDRRAVAAIVFGSAEQLKRLEELLYPRIDRRRASLMMEFEANPGMRAMVIDAPKLYEAGVDAHCDVVLFVDSDRPVRLRRVAARGWGEEELDRRERLQIPLDKKKVMADYIVENNSSIEMLRTQVERIFTSILESYSKTV